MQVQVLTVNSETGRTHWQHSHRGIVNALKHLNKHTRSKCHVFFFDISDCLEKENGECKPLTGYNIESWNPSTHRLQLHVNSVGESIIKHDRNEKVAETA